MEKISLGFILNATGGRLARECFNIKVNNVSTDSRTVSPGSLFIALSGDSFDGHDYIKTAFDKGAFAALAERPVENVCRPVIIVKDTHAALLHLAQAYRMIFDLPIAGITGSVGKTSTKEAVCAVLSQKYKTHKNEGNRNNEIGMPMSVFGLDRTHKAAVFEMGMSGFGEISRLTRVANPDVGIITNIGVSHIGKLGSRENILKAKLEITDGMKADGQLILNGDDDMLRSFIEDAAGRLPIKISTYGIKSRDGVYADGIVSNAAGSDFDIHYKNGCIRTHMPVPGEHNIYNALAAFCTGLSFGVEPRAAVAGLAAYKPTGMRQKIEKCGGVTFIEDCYNASPDSMNAAFNVLKTVKSGRTIAVLADMLELGAESQAAHFSVGKSAAESGIDVLICYGNDSKNCCDGFNSATSGGESCFFEEKKALADAISGILHEGDTVLFKASRGMKLEETYGAVYEGWKNK